MTAGAAGSAAGQAHPLRNLRVHDRKRRYGRSTVAWLALVVGGAACTPVS